VAAQALLDRGSRSAVETEGALARKTIDGARFSWWGELAQP
jgi:hypothetical protein